MNQQTGKYFIIGGICIVIAGVIIYFFHDYLKWFGKLPGDVRIEKENYKFYFPLVSMIIISIAVTVIINVIKRFL